MAVVQDEKVGQGKEVAEMWLTAEGLRDKAWVKKTKVQLNRQTSERMVSKTLPTTEA
jgi:hypothetical protein